MLTPTVVIPEDTGVTLIEGPKFNVLAVPTELSLFFIAIPVPSAVTPLSPEPSPTNDVAVNAPDDELNLRFVPVLGA